MEPFSKQLLENNINIPDTSAIFELEKELAEKEQYLQHTIEELETTNEELKSSNEEAQSTNEELQSTNEELETSKEELQSVNEELTTTNNELSLKLDELNRLNSQLNNLLSATEIATIFIDKELKIFNFTPAISIITELLISDIGRSIKQFTNNLKYKNLILDINSVLNTLIPKESEVESVDGRCFWMRIIPYRTIDDKIEGVVLTFTEITRRIEIEKALKESEEKYRETYENSPDSIIIHDLDMNIGDLQILNGFNATLKYQNYIKKDRTAANLNLSVSRVTGKQHCTEQFVFIRILM